MMKRITLFLFTNFAVMILLGIILSILGCFTITGNIKLIIVAGIFGFGGAFVSLLLSKSIALFAVRGVIVEKSSSDMEYWLLQIIRDYSKKLNINVPQLAIYNSQDMNAFATGVSRNSALVAVSNGLLDNMNRESIEAVIAHEMSHIASGDMVTMTLIQGIVNTFVIFISRSLTNLIYYWIYLVNDESNGKCVDDSNNNYYSGGNINNSFVYMIISSILELFFGVLASIIVFWFSRRREFYADAGSAKLVGREKMIAALQELKCNYESNIMSNNIVTLYINNPMYNKKNTSLFFYDLFSSHPSLDKRIEALQSGLYLKSSYFFD